MISPTIPVTERQHKRILTILDKLIYLNDLEVYTIKVKKRR